MKRLLSWLMALVLVVLLVPAVTASADAWGYTTIKDTSSAMLNNLGIAMRQIDRWYVGYGETFSFNTALGPRTKAMGYQEAVNGRGVSVLGGGTSQVAASIYLAVKQMSDSLDIVEKHTFDNFTGGYVDNADDAIACDADDGWDFRFTNYWADLFIRLYRDEDNRLYCELISSGDGSSGNRGVEWLPELDYEPFSVKANQELAFRTGPNTKYTMIGNYPQSTTVKAYYQTSGNDVMWVLLEFTSDGGRYMGYTGMKRIDGERVPKDSEAGSHFTVIERTRPLYGPGYGYATQRDVIPVDARVTGYFQLHGYAMVDYYDGEQTVRGWVPTYVLE